MHRNQHLRPVAKPRRPLRVSALVVAVAILAGCEPVAPAPGALDAQEPISVADFATLIERVSEPGGYFDTDNLISNESGYLNVMDALADSGLRGGAYVGVGPDQNYSYIAELRPEIAFIIDVRRDNLLQHLLLKALIERSPTRVSFLSNLHGVAPPEDPEAWRDRDLETVVTRVDSVWMHGVSDPGSAAGRRTFLEALHDSVAAHVGRFGVPLSPDDQATIRRFHEAFIEAGLGLRFTSFGRPPRPYYPTYRQLVMETDADGDRASYLADEARYAVVRDLHVANRVIPVVGDLSGSHALRELGRVLDETGSALTAFYVSNVEFYLWQSRTLDAWVYNLGTLPRAPGAVVIRSYFPNFGRGHPSAIPGYYATQSLQPMSSLVQGGFRSYWDVVTRDVLPLR